MMVQIQEECDDLMNEVDTLFQDRAEIQTKCLLLEQINLDFSNKVISQAEDWIEKEISVNEQVNQLTFLADMRNKFFTEVVKLLQQAINSNKKQFSDCGNKLEQIVKAKQRQEVPDEGNQQMHLKSVLYERDNLEMELKEALQQIDRLEQEKSDVSKSIMVTEMGAGDFQTIPDNLSVNLQVGPNKSSITQAKQKHVALKLGVPSLDLSTLKGVKEYKDWYGYS